MLKTAGFGFATAVVGVLLLAGLTGALPVVHLGSSSSGTASAEPILNAQNADPQLPTPIKHVFLILMENEQTGIIYGQQPYETMLANKYAWGGNANNPPYVGYYAVCHPSAPNYLALTSGRSLQCNSDAYNTYSVNNLGNMLDTAHESWVAWSESATVPCQTTDSGNYVVRHQPFTYYSDLGPGVPGSVCATHVLPIANLTLDYSFAQTPPAFTYIAPNILNDGHSSSAATGDWWLSTFVPKLIAQPYFKSSAIFIVYDEAYDEEGNENFSGYDGLLGGPVYMAVVSPFTHGMGALTFNSSHYNLLSTMEFLLGLPPTGAGTDGTSTFPVLAPMFNDQIFGPGDNFAYTNLPGVDLAGRNLAGATFQYSNLEGADLAGVNLAGANLNSVDLDGANLQGAYLAGADLRYADLAGANLNGAYLAGALLQHANLIGASLSGAQLFGAVLKYANLLGATLTGLGPGSLQTNFNGANLYDAVLVNAVCGSPNYITAFGANTEVIGAPAACVPPL